MAKKTTKKKIVAPPSALYRRIAFSFLGAAIILLGVVLSVSLSRARIIITPKREPLTAELSVDVRREAAAGEVRGVVRISVAEAERTFFVTGGGGVIVETAARGAVVITNTTARDQTLVRTTRLLSPAGALFHIDRTVVVSARGSVQVGVYADKAGPGGEIGPTRFSIPGLWVGLQNKIYAESFEPMCCGTETQRLLTEADVENAEREMTISLLEAAKTELRAKLNGGADPRNQGFSGEQFHMARFETQNDARVGTVQGQFRLSASMVAIGVFYDRQALEAIAAGALRNLAGEERELVELDPGRISVIVERYDEKASTARLSVEATGLLVLKPDHELFSKEQLFGLDRAAVESYFKAFRAIESVRIEFQPPWLRAVPRLKDHIEIRIGE